MICKFKKIFTFSLVAFSLFFIGNVVNAMGPRTEWLNSGSVVASQDSQTIAVNNFIHSTSIRMRVYGVTSLDASKDYSFRVNFSLRTQGSNPYITQCGLNINNSYVSTSSLTYSRTSREIGSSFTDSSFAVTANYTMISGYGDVPIFIQCDLNDLYLQSNYTATATSGQGSIINSIDQNGQNIISNNNYNTDKQNANRDSNTTRDIENRTSLFNGLQQTLSNILQNLQDKLNDVKTGISNVINSGVNLLISAMDGLQMGINGVISKLAEISSNIVNAIADIVSPIVTAIGNGINSVVNKIGELIGLQEVCELYYSTSGSDVLHGDPNYEIGILQNDGSILHSGSSYAVSPYLPIAAPDELHFNNNMSSGTNLYACFYGSNNSLIDCRQINAGSETTFTFNANSGRRFVRYTFRISYSQLSSLRGQCHRSGIVGIFNSFTNFVRKLFDNTIGNVWEDLNNINKIQDTPVTDLILMPLSLIDAFHTALSSNTCTGYTIPFDFTGGNNTLTLPCINLESYLGSTLWSAIDLILMGLMIYSIAMMCVSFFESWSSLHDTFDFLYNVGPNKGR